MNMLTLHPGKLTLQQLREISRHKVTLSLNNTAAPAMQASVETVHAIIADDQTVYGINTGFGLLANTRIALEDLETLQRSIVLSHAAGIGDYMADHTVRLMMALKINSLARGYSGIRPDVVNALITLVNTSVYPCIPQKGSVGRPAIWHR